MHFRPSPLGFVESKYMWFPWFQTLLDQFVSHIMTFTFPVTVTLKPTLCGAGEEGKGNNIHAHVC